MAELNLKQITDKLSSEFSSDVRRLIFWVRCQRICFRYR